MWTNADKIVWLLVTEMGHDELKQEQIQMFYICLDKNFVVM